VRGACGLSTPPRISFHQASGQNLTFDTHRLGLESTLSGHSAGHWELQQQTTVELLRWLINRSFAGTTACGDPSRRGGYSALIFSVQLPSDSRMPLA